MIDQTDKKHKKVTMLRWLPWSRRHFSIDLFIVTITLQKALNVRKPNDGEGGDCKQRVDVMVEIDPSN